MKKIKKYYNYIVGKDMKNVKKYKEFIIKNRYNILTLILYIFLYFQLKNIFVFDDDFVVKFPVYMQHTFTNIIDWIANRMSYFYNEWSGRLVTHFITTAALSFFGVSFFTFLHPIIMFIMALLISKILNLINCKIDKSKTIFLISLLAISSTIIIVRENHFWITGSVPYVWGFTLLLGIFYILLKYDQENKLLSKSKIIIISLLLIINAFTLEQYGTITIGIIFIFLIKSYLKKSKEKTNAYLLFEIIAIVFLILSCLIPGNFAKANSYSQEKMVAKEQLLENTDININVNGIKETTISKTISIIGYFLDKDILLIYMSFVSLVLFFNWFFKKKRKSKLEKIEYTYLIILTLCFLLNEVYTIVKLFNTSEFFNTYIYISSYSNYPIYLINLYILLFIIYFIIHAKLLYRYLSQYSEMLWWLWLISIVSVIMPVSLVAYHGARYVWPTYIIYLIIIVIMLDKNNKKSINYSLLLLSLFGSAFLFNNTKNILLPILIIIFIKVNENTMNKVLMNLLIILLFANQIYAMCMFYYNKIIIDYNENELLNAKDNETIYLREIPYITEKYTWHTFFSDSDGYHYHYIYLYKWVKQYYGIDPNNIKVIESYIPTGRE